LHRRSYLAENRIILFLADSDDLMGSRLTLSRGIGPVRSVESAGFFYS
jgi:hypothetical protein